MRAAVSGECAFESRLRARMSLSGGRCDLLLRDASGMDAILEIFRSSCVEMDKKLEVVTWEFKLLR